MWKYTGKRKPEFAIEPAPGQESVWDYPRPPICRVDEREVLVKFGKEVIAQSKRSIRVLETASPPTFYIPPKDVHTEKLVRSNGSSFCEWKGLASYWALKSMSATDLSVGWSYENPSAQFVSITNYISFYPSIVE